MITPRAIDMEIAAQKTFIPETVIVQDLAGGRIFWEVRRGDAVQANTVKGMIHPQGAGGGSDACAMHTRMYPVANPAFTDTTVLDIA